MTRKEPIRLLDDLGTQFEHAAVAEDGRRPGLLEQIRTRLTYPNAGRTIAIALASTVLVGSIAYAIPATREIVEDIAGKATDSEDPKDDGAAKPNQRALTQVRGADGRRHPVVLIGDREDAQQGVRAVQGLYDGLRKAVGVGVANDNIRVVDAAAAADGVKSLRRVCGLMSEQAQRETIVYVRDSAGRAGVDWSCEGAMLVLLRRAGQTGRIGRIWRGHIDGINTVGDRATVSMKVGDAITTISLVKEDGEWKVGSLPEGGGG